MAKYSGNVGFVETVEVSPGRWDYQVTERRYKGDVFKNTRRWEARDSLLDTLNANNMISIVAKDAYAFQHASAIRYIWWMGARWNVTNIEVQRPRLILTIGGIYNGPEREVTDGSGDITGE